jgi:uncharacterized protein (DUF302 family)
MRIPALITALALSCCATFTAHASDTIYEKSAPLAADVAYQRLYDGLEARGYFVIFEPDMGKNLARMQDKFGADYNRNGLEVMKSLVFCNPSKTNQMSNLDPTLLALCPLHLTLTHKGGVSTAHFGRVSALAAGSPGEALIRGVEAEILGIIEDALHGK